MKKEREFSLDVVRALAVFLVIAVHFFMNSGYYKADYVGFDKIIMEVIRLVAMTCVPLFLLLTGYLKNNKKLTKQYYYGIIPIYIIYVLSSIAVMIYKIIVTGKQISVIAMIKNILNFTGANYAWYVEMYIGLFLLIPFLNVLWNNLKNKKEHQMLIITLLICTTLPSIVNSFNFSSNVSDFLVAKTGKDQLIPDWWVNLYPIMYYFIGCYFCKYKGDFKLKPKYIFTTLICVCFIFACCNYYRNVGETFRKENFYFNWYGFEIVLNSLLLFIGIISIKFKNRSNFIKKIITKISEISFGTYLVSFIFDNIFYKILCNKVEIITDRWIYYPLIVIVIFVCSNILSFILYFIKDIGLNCYSIILSKIKSNVN